MKIVKCKLCERKLKAKLSRKRGYGPVCWEKVQEEKQPTNNQYEEKIVKLESLINRLTMRVNSLMRDTPYNAPTPSNGSAIPIHAPEYSINELTASPLYLKMQQLADNT